MLIRLRTANVEIRPVGPVDFLGYGGFPLSHVVITDIKKRVMTQWEQAKAAMESSSNPDSESEQAEKTTEIIKKIVCAGIKTVNLKPFSSETFFDSKDISVVELFYLFEKIMDLSLMVFRQPLRLTRDELVEWYSKSKSFGIEPIRLLVPSGNYTSLDAYMFDNAVQYCGLSQELEALESQQSEIKRRLGK